MFFCSTLAADVHAASSSMACAQGLVIGALILMTLTLHAPNVQVPPGLCLHPKLTSVLDVSVQSLSCSSLCRTT
jgi:hypothetical protein